MKTTFLLLGDTLLFTVAKDFNSGKEMAEVGLLKTGKIL